MPDPVLLDFAYGLSTVTLGAETPLLTDDESAAWKAAIAACRVGAEEGARPLIVRSGPRADAAVKKRMEIHPPARQGV